MKERITKVLCCPRCRSDLDLHEGARDEWDVVSGHLICNACGADYAIEGCVPRFVSTRNYAATFGCQWNRYRRTQLDSHSGLSVSQDRFFAETGWRCDDLADARVLDAGCGAGRFAEVALACGAELFAVDYSTAVDACWANLSPHPTLHVIQADLRNLPFKAETFDLVYCLGVLQHLPDVREGFMALAGQVRPGGRLVVDAYAKSVKNLLWGKYWIRPFTKRLPQDTLFRLVNVLVRYLLPLSRKLGRASRISGKLRRLLPVANYEGIYSLSEDQIKEWSLLDTFDMLSPRYDRPQSAATLRGLFADAGFHQTEVFRREVWVGRGVKG